MQRAELTLIVVTAVVAVVIAGCGGGSGSSATGDISVSVVFPEQSQPAGPAPQELPQATNSVRIQVIPFKPGNGNGVIVGGKPGASQSGGEPVVPDLVITRDPDSTQVGGTVKGVPPGDYLLRALAYESDDGTGQVIAQAQAQTRVVAGATSRVHLFTEALTVLVEVLPPVLVVGVQEQAPLTAICRDADGNEVPGEIEWSSDDQTVATVSADGIVTGVSAGGSCLITATDLISGAQGYCEVTVVR